MLHAYEVRQTADLNRNLLYQLAPPGRPGCVKTTASRAIGRPEFNLNGCFC